MMHVKHVDHATNIKLYSLLLEKKNHTSFWNQDEKLLEFSLLDILEKSSSLPETEVQGPFTFSDTILSELNVAVTAEAVVDVNVSAAATKFQEASLQFQIVTVPPPKLEELRQRKLLNPQPSYIMQYWGSGNIYVVTKTVNLLNSPVLTDIRSGSVSGGLSFLFNLASKAKGEGKCQKWRERKLSLNKDMVIAYKKKQLIFRDDGWSVIDPSSDKKNKTFEEFQNRGSFEVIMTRGPILPIGRLEKPCGPDFKLLEEEVFLKVETVTLLSRNIRSVMFINIQALLEDRQALQDLVDTLEQGKPWGHLNGPGGTILNELERNPPGYPHVDPAYLTLYLLGAIMALSDTQHALLAWSMERGILAHQWKLVRSILEPNFKYPWSIPFTLSPQLLAPLRGEAEAVTYGLLEECGLRMEESNPRSTWDLEAREPLSALYASLCILQCLIEP